MSWLVKNSLPDCFCYFALRRSQVRSDYLELRKTSNSCCERCTEHVMFNSCRVHSESKQENCLRDSFFVFHCGPEASNTKLLASGIEKVVDILKYEKYHTT